MQLCIHADHIVKVLHKIKPRWTIFYWYKQVQFQDKRPNFYTSVESLHIMQQIYLATNSPQKTRLE